MNNHVDLCKLVLSGTMDPTTNRTMLFFEGKVDAARLLMYACHCNPSAIVEDYNVKFMRIINCMRTG